MEPLEYKEIVFSEKAIQSAALSKVIVQYKDVDLILYVIPSYGSYFQAKFGPPCPGILYIITKATNYWEDVIRIFASHQETKTLPKCWLEKVFFSNGRHFPPDINFLLSQRKGVRYYWNRFKKRLKKKR